MLKKLNFNAGGIVDFLIVRGTQEESETLFNAHFESAVDYIQPLIKNHIEVEEKILEKVHAITTLEGLEKEQFNLVPKAVFAKVTEYFNNQTNINDQERVFIMSRVLDVTITSLQNWLGEQIQARAQRIAKSPQSKIVGMNGRPFKATKPNNKN